MCLSTGVAKVFSKLLKFHQLLKTLVYREAQVFSD